MKRRDTGILGEKLARDYLRRQGYRIRQSNYRCPEGEIDIVAEHKDYLVFVEVKARRSLEFGIPEEAVTADKRERLRLAAAHYRQEHEKLPQLWRIDVVAIELDSQNRPSRLEIIENAVGEE
jgi:putative endonuclease